MTIDRLTLRRERSTDWPALRDIPVSADIEILSLELTRPAGSDTAGIVEQASVALCSAMRSSTELRELSLWAVVATAPSLPLNRSAVARMLKSEPSADLPQLGSAWSAFPMSYEDNSVGFLASTPFALENLPAAVEMSLRETAIVLALDARASDPIGPLGDYLQGSTPSRRIDLLPLAIQFLSEDSFAIRGFGKFDDAAVGVDIFSGGHILRLLEESLQGLGISLQPEFSSGEGLTD